MTTGQEYLLLNVLRELSDRPFWEQKQRMVLETDVEQDELAPILIELGRKGLIKIDMELTTEGIKELRAWDMIR